MKNLIFNDILKSTETNQNIIKLNQKILFNDDHELEGSELREFIIDFLESKDYKDSSLFVAIDQELDFYFEILTEQRQGGFALFFMIWEEGALGKVIFSDEEEEFINIFETKFSNYFEEN